jgi:hypothetical protein
MEKVGGTECPNNVNNHSWKLTRMNDKNNMNCRSNPFACATAHTCCKWTFTNKNIQKIIITTIYIVLCTLYIIRLYSGLNATISDQFLKWLHTSPFCWMSGSATIIVIPIFPWMQVHMFWFNILQLRLSFYTQYLKVTSNQHTVYCMPKFGWWHCRHYILNAFFQNVFSARNVTTHYILQHAPHINISHLVKEAIIPCPWNRH